MHKNNIFYVSFVTEKGECYLILFAWIFIKKHWKNTQETNNSEDQIGENA